MKTYPEMIAEGMKRTIFQEELLTEASIKKMRPIKVTVARDVDLEELLKSLGGGSSFPPEWLFFSEYGEDVDEGVADDFGVNFDDFSGYGVFDIDIRKNNATIKLHSDFEKFLSDQNVDPNKKRNVLVKAIKYGVGEFEEMEGAKVS